MRFLLMLLLMNVAILIHEGFHYLAALACGIGVTEFSVGLGPSLLHFLLPDGATFHLRAIPFAGYVEPVLEGPNGLASAGFWSELLMYVSGMLGSVTIAFIYFSVIGVPRMLKGTPAGENFSRGKSVAVAFRLTFLEWLSAPGSLMIALVRRPKDVLRSVQGPIGLLFGGAPASPLEDDERNKSPGHQEVSAPESPQKNQDKREANAGQPGLRLAGFTSIAMYLCVALSAFNLLPIYPFDGGRILVLFAEKAFGQGLVVDFLAYAGLVLAGLLILVIFAKDLVVLVASKLRRK